MDEPRAGRTGTISWTGRYTVRTVGFTAEGHIVITFERTLLVYRRGHGPRVADVTPEWDRRSLAAAGVPVEDEEAP